LISSCRTLAKKSGFSHIDLPRLRTGGLAGGIFAMFVPPEEGRSFPSKKDVQTTAAGWQVPAIPAVPQAYAESIARGMLAFARQLESDSKGQLAICRTVEQIRDCMASRTLAIVLHFEGAEAIKPDLSNFGDFHDAGLRSLGLVWSRPNAFGEGVPFQYPASPDTGPGLTEAGKELIKACLKRKVLIDLAHLNEKGFWDVADITSQPLVVSHAGVHTLTPTSRNLTDKQLDAIGASGGLLGITFSVTDVRPDGNHDADTPLQHLVDHIRYVADRIGIDHVALGSDYDGATVPVEVGDVSKLPALITALQENGFDIAALKKITSENWLRVLESAWQ